MARKVEPPEDIPAPPPPAADLLPDLQAKIELATRTLAIIERRIAAWESELAALRGELRDQVQPTDVPDAARFGDLEARIARLERRQLKQMARQTAEAGEKAALGANVPIAIEGVGEDSRAIVFARWSSTECTTGETLKLSAMVDGFEPGEVVTFTIVALDGSQPCDPLEAAVGEADNVQVKWKAPKTGRSKTAEFYFEANAGPHVARSPVLTVMKG